MLMKKVLQLEKISWLIDASDISNIHSFIIEVMIFINQEKFSSVSKINK
jgi:hypothetical protein